MQPLTDEKLVDILEGERQTYSRDKVPLHHIKITSIEKCYKLAAQNPKEIRRNVLRKRACIILSDLWASAPAVFVLRASVIPPNTLRINPSTSYLGRVLKWWKEVDHPRGLTHTVQEIDAMKSLPSYDNSEDCLANQAPKETQTTTNISGTTPPTDQSRLWVQHLLVFSPPLAVLEMRK